MELKEGSSKGEALRLLRTNSSKPLFEENIKKLEITPSREGIPRGFYPKDPLPFVTKYHPAVPNLKPVLMNNWQLIRQQPLLREIYRDPPLISY